MDIAEKLIRTIESDKINQQYVSKLEQRIHNQRVALRNNWMVVEERAKERPKRLESKWFEYVKKQNKIIKNYDNLFNLLNKLVIDVGALGEITIDSSSDFVTDAMKILNEIDPDGQRSNS